MSLRLLLLGCLSLAGCTTYTVSSGAGGTGGDTGGAGGEAQGGAGGGCNDGGAPVGYDTDGVYEGSRYDYDASDETLGYGHYPEHPTASAGSACLVTIHVNTPPDKHYKVTGTTLSGTGNTPFDGQMALISPDGAVDKGPAFGDTGAWSGVLPNFDLEYQDGTTLAGKWTVVLPHPDEEPPAATLGPCEIASLCEAYYGTITLTMPLSALP